MHLRLCLLLSLLSMGASGVLAQNGSAGLLVPPAREAPRLFAVPTVPPTWKINESILTPSTIIAELPDYRKVAVPRAYRFDDLALFCRWEVRMEQKATFPVKFRLGDIPTVDRLEGKD